MFSMLKGYCVGPAHSQLYARYRPAYTKKIFDAVIEYCREGSCEFYLAVDVGCGSGQSTTFLCDHFRSVIGIDVSQTQIDEAQFQCGDIPNLSFRIGSAEDMSFIKNESVDLVTCAVSIHWMDREKFYTEVDRILKPKGSLVVYSYDRGEPDNDKAKTLVGNDSKFLREVIAPYYPKEWLDFGQFYRNLPLPYVDSKRNHDLKIVKQMTVDDYFCYISTFLFYQRHKPDHPDSTILDDLSKEFKSIYGDNLVTVTWSVIMRFSRKPS